MVITYARPSTSNLNTLDTKTPHRSQAMSTTLLYANLKLPRSVYCKFSCGGKTKPNFRFWPVYGQNKYRFQGTQKQVSTTIVLAPKKMSDLKSLIKFSPERKPAFLSFQKRWKHFSEKNEIKNDCLLFEMKLKRLESALAVVCFP